jgi:phosphonate transport system permease protein
MPETVGFAVCSIFSLVVALSSIFQGNLINEGGWTLVLRFLVAATHPDFSPELLKLTLDATLKTLAYAVCGTAFSILIGLVGGVLSSEVWWQSVSGVRSLGAGLQLLVRRHN